MPLPGNSPEILPNNIADTTGFGIKMQHQIQSVQGSTSDKIFVKDIKDRDQIKEVFLVKEKITAMAKNGKPYMTLRLMDKTGEVDAKIWDNIDQIAPLFEKNDFLKVAAKASVYLGKMQLVIPSCAKCLKRK